MRCRYLSLHCLKCISSYVCQVSLIAKELACYPSAHIAKIITLISKFQCFTKFWYLMNGFVPWDNCTFFLLYQCVFYIFNHPTRDLKHSIFSKYGQFFFFLVLSVGSKVWTHFCIWRPPIPELNIPPIPELVPSWVLKPHQFPLWKIHSWKLLS